MLFEGRASAPTQAANSTLKKCTTGLMKPIATRNDGLDILRMMAISLVLIHHTVQMSPVTSEFWRNLAHFGAYGVNLFFVLSGWLIGMIFWREIAATGTLNLSRFWYRRWMRTIPPYLIALFISWSAVAVVRDQPFDFSYLLFLQNYKDTVPFFLVSWSLCVEEHFYIVAPLVGLLMVTRLRVQIIVVVLLALIITPLVLRGLVPANADISSFGYYRTATHLSFEGLAFGILLAYLHIFNEDILERIKLLAVWVAGFGFAGIIILELQILPSRINYTLNQFLVAIIFSALLLMIRNVAIANHALRRLVFAIAVSSYSCYLVHALCLHIAVALNSQFFNGHFASFFVISAAIIFFATLVFYHFVERTAIFIRDSWAFKS